MQFYGLNCNGYHATHYNLPKLAEEDNFKSPTKLHTLWANSENKNCNFIQKNLFKQRGYGRDVI